MHGLRGLGLWVRGARAYFRWLLGDADGGDQSLLLEELVVGDPESGILEVDDGRGHVDVHLDDADLQVDLDQLLMKLDLVATLGLREVVPRVI